ncbi:hypothetical protein QBC44DRAFT_362480 [Cladorrhinum sp. PSN332]|nr:hypothetical protein QBC44DRAFT_362480 [Cladorrhinum sp. PSN332]
MSSPSPYPTFGLQFPPTPAPSPSPSSSSRVFSEERRRIASRLSRCIEAEPQEEEELQVEEQIGEDPFREPIEIPGCSPPIFVYPHSSAVINHVFQERFREVINLFRHNTLDDPRLRENVRLIDYTLRLCGTSPAEAHPSILVFCRHKEFKHLKPLLTSRELKFQYALRKTSTRKFPWSKSELSPLRDSHRPSFNLYFWRERIPRTLYWGHQSPIRIQPGSSGMAPDFTLCGSIVTHGLGIDMKSFSTLGCVIQAGSEWYAVTSRHAFYHELSGIGSDYLGTWMDYLPDLSIITAPSPQAFSVSDGKPRKCAPVHEEEDYFIDDVEYDSLTESDGEQDSVEGDSEVAPQNENNKDADNSNGLEYSAVTVSEHVQQSQRFTSLSQRHEYSYQFPTGIEQYKLDELDRDWAVIELKDPKDWRPNAVPNPSSDQGIQFISAVAEPFPSSTAPVLIITSGSVPHKGVLQHGITFLGCINGNRPAEVHTVVLNKGEELRRGDSGAMVVDAATKAIYGLVVGSNPLGEIYITPFHAILDQIRQRFSGVPVGIPEPLEAFKKLTSYLILRAEQRSEAERFWKDAIRRNSELEKEVRMLHLQLTAQDKVREEMERKAALEKRRLKDVNKTLQARIASIREAMKQMEKRQLDMEWNRAQIEANRSSVPPPASQLPVPSWLTSSAPPVNEENGSDAEGIVKEETARAWKPPSSVAGASSADSGYHSASSCVGDSSTSAARRRDERGLDVLWEADDTFIFDN